MHTGVSGHANCGIILARVRYGAFLMVKGVNDFGVSYGDLFQGYKWQVIIVDCLFSTCKLNILMKGSRRVLGSGYMNVSSMLSIN